MGKEQLLELLAKNDTKSAEALEIMINKLIELGAFEDVLEKIKNISTTLEPFNEVYVTDFLNSIGKNTLPGVTEQALIIYKSNFDCDGAIIFGENFSLNEKFNFSITQAYNIIQYKIKKEIL